MEETSLRLYLSGMFYSRRVLIVAQGSLLRARATFLRDGYLNPPDYDESLCRATACEVLARRIIHTIPPDRLESVMSARFRYRESDGDESPATSCLETAIDQHCTVGKSTTNPSVIDLRADIPCFIRSPTCSQFSLER